MVALFCFTLAACQAAAPKPPTRAAATAPSGNLELGLDPCAIQLQEIGSAILLYYTLHHGVPPTLADLQTIGDIDSPLHFTCPVSGKPYVYVPTGLAIAGQDRRLIVYDEAAMPNGSRWGLAVELPEGPRPMTINVVRLTQADLDAALKPVE